MAKGGKGKKAIKAPKVLEPLPGPELLHPVLTYSEDSPAAPRDAFGRDLTVTTSFETPPEEESEVGDVDDDGSLHDSIPPEFRFRFEDPPDIDELNALIRAEENSDDAKSDSSFTDQEEEAKAEDDPTVDSGETASEVTGSDTDLEGYDIADLISEDSTTDSDRSARWSAEVSANESVTLMEDSDAPKRKKTKPKAGDASTAKKSRKVFVEPMSNEKAQWLTRKFAELFTSKSDSKTPLYVTVEDLLETNIDFRTMDAGFLNKLREIADATPVALRPQLQRSADFEVPSRSSSAESAKRRADAAAKLQAKPKIPVNDGKKSRASPKGKGAKKVKEVLQPPPSKQVVRPFPAELYEEQQRSRPLKKPWLKKEELLATNDEQDAWVTESCEDINFIEYRRERVLKGKKVPIGKTDFEMDLIAGRLASKLLAYETAVNKALPDSDMQSATTQPIEEQFALPPKPLIPVRVNPSEDPNDEDTSSEEDEQKGKEKRAGKALTDPYHIPSIVHEDDKYDYYNTSRSSSECESVDKVIRKEVGNQIRFAKTQGMGSPAVAPLVIDGYPYNPILPLEDKEVKSLPVDDLYALAHDLQMPPGELRKELQRPDDDLDYDQDSDEDGWQYVRGTFLYEKTPAFYAVQIKDLEQKICLKREEWILHELEYSEYSVKSHVELAALDEFIVYLGEQSRKEKEKVAVLQVELERLRDEAWKATEYQNWWTAYLEEQKAKTIDRYVNRKEFVQVKLFALRENIEKQRQMEALLCKLRHQHRSAKSAYTAKVSHMLLTSARKKKQLFLDYERRIGQVFKEYQRALVLSMNDNLQEACSAHVTGRRIAKAFSDRAISAIAGFKRANDKLTVAQEKVATRTELLALSTRHADKAEAQLARLQEIAAYEKMKMSRRAESARSERRAKANLRRTEVVRVENSGLEKLIDDLLVEKQTLMDHLSAEQSVNKQMENHLGKLVTTVKDYMVYLKGGEKEKEETGLAQIESFEDRFIRYLHYAAEIEGLLQKRKYQKRPFLAEGDLGFVPRPKMLK
ncbi:hypothetical protein BV898_00835 [Hypsibius exemplaris]|uniref:Uncharacterized protein n=1 Tax=Hypsibius exemplaris TaxID=2072580 RepID=A0A1W0XCD4_HYPEX|nr:hypothetical protein BV898_00835 [Hypsibius exemplaris]